MFVKTIARWYLIAFCIEFYVEQFYQISFVFCRDNKCRDCKFVARSGIQGFESIEKTVKSFIGILFNVGCFI